MPDVVVDGREFYLNEHGVRTPHHARGYNEAYVSEDTAQKIRNIIAVLDEWFWAIEDGSYIHRVPDPFYVRRFSKPDWSDEDVERIIAWIDKDFDTEVKSHVAHWGDRGYHKGARYGDMPMLQKRAMVQQLDNCIKGLRSRMDNGKNTANSADIDTVRDPAHESATSENHD